MFRALEQNTVQCECEQNIFSMWPSTSATPHPRFYFTCCIWAESVETRTEHRAMKNQQTAVSYTGEKRKVAPNWKEHDGTMAAQRFPASKRGWSLSLPAVHSNNCSTQYLRRGTVTEMLNHPSCIIPKRQEGRECESLISIHGCTHQHISYQPQGGRRTNCEGQMICADLLCI